MNSELIEKSNNAGYRLRRYLLSKYKNIKIETVLQKEIQTLLKAVNDNNFNLFLETITPIYLKYELNMPNVFYEMLNDEEHFVKILSAFIFGLKGAYKSQKGQTIVINGELCYDIKTICDMLGVKKLTIYEWLKKGKLTKANTDGMKKIYIKKSEVDNFLSAKKDN